MVHLANVGCDNLPVRLTRIVEELGRDAAMRQLAAIWKDDIPLQKTEHTLYPTVERLPGEVFTPTALLLANLDDTMLFAPGDYENLRTALSRRLSPAAIDGPSPTSAKAHKAAEVRSRTLGLMLLAPPIRPLLLSS
jgi:hypothetical protein